MSNNLAIKKLKVCFVDLKITLREVSSPLHHFTITLMSLIKQAETTAWETRIEVEYYFLPANVTPLT
jgi:hypothetical protein